MADSDFVKHKANAQVKDCLESIEDKLRERGLLTTATGDNESEVTIYYDEYGEDNNKGPHLLISINSTSPRKLLSEEHFEAISDYVNEKIGELSEEWPQDVSAALADIFGQVVLLNGNKVY